MTDKSFSTFDMALVNEYKKTYYASPFGFGNVVSEDYAWFKDKRQVVLSVDNRRKSTGLCFMNRTHQAPCKFSLKNAERDLKKLLNSLVLFYSSQ